MSLVIESVSRRFGAFPALKGVSLTIPQGAFVALLGPSGSGKTTLLRIIAGLDFADEGTVRFDGEDVSALSVGERHVGTVETDLAFVGVFEAGDDAQQGRLARSRGTE